MTAVRAGLARGAVPAGSGLLLALAFPPFDLGPLALLALVPLLARWRRTSPLHGAIDGLVAGVVFFGVVAHWAWLFGIVAYVPLVLVLGASWAGVGAVAGLVGRRRPASPWLLAAAWVLFEALRARFPLGGLSWGEVGYAFHDLPWFRSLAGWGGVLLVSFVAVALSGHLAVAVEAIRGDRRRDAGRALAVVGALVALAAVAHLALPDTTPARSVEVAIVQGNDRNRRLTQAEVEQRFLPTSHLELADRLDRSVDLVVFPESSLDIDPRRDPWLDQQLSETARSLDAFVVANAPVDVDGGEHIENTNFLYDRTGTLVDTYVKVHLVPFGEYIPARSWLDFVDEIEQVPVDHVAGEGRVVFDAGGVRLANLVCFESAFTEIARGYAADGAQILLVVTNNRSFGRSANSAQHLAIGQIRAVETGRPLVHAGVSGKSAFVSATGDVSRETDLFERTTATRVVEGRTGSTPYVVAGDWIILVSAALLAVAALRDARDRFARMGAAS